MGAHDYVRPHSEESSRESGPSRLNTLLRELLSPYPALDEGRLTIEGGDWTVDDRFATPIALVFHELATNASKYGALSNSSGRVRIVCSAGDGRVRIEWQERGGPPIQGEPAQTGFGSRLTEISVVQQLGGTLKRHWERDGLRVEVEMPAEALDRG
jgi:two-component sensor histidine kinase